MLLTENRREIPFHVPDIGDAEIEAVTSVLRSGWITSGLQVQQFEKQFAASVGSKHAIALNSCTAALHLSLEAIGLTDGDEVITTPFTFAATAEVIRYFNARPVFVDVDPGSLNIDPKKIQAALTAKTKAILPVHFAGLATDVDEIQMIARRQKIPVIADAAHAFPAVYKGRLVGSMDDFTCFSFYATKTLTTGEGGMICTNDDRWAERCRVMSLHGISRDAWKRYSRDGGWYYEIEAPGYKYNMTDIAAAMGRVQLGNAESMWGRRKAIAERYTGAFAENPALQVPMEASADGRHAWHLYVLRLNESRLKLDRARFIEELKRRGVGTSVHFIPLHVQPYYQRTYGYFPEDFPVSHGEYRRVVSLPIYSRMTDEDVSHVIRAVAEITAEFRV